jgi:Transposase IS66 family.
MQYVSTELYPLYEELAKQVLASDYLQIDETTLPVVDNEKKRAVKGYVWAVRDMVNSQMFFHYDKGSRSQKTLVSLLCNYRGAIQSDGYEAYKIYENKDGVLLLNCWAHVRRKFENALKEDEQNANKALDYISLLYQIEANLKEKNLTNEEISDERKRLAYPILQEFENWMLKIFPELLPKSLMGKAVAYTFSLYHGLVRYVADGKFQIDNNPVENVIRPLALGRKNYLFCGNHDTAEDAALFYSFFGSCKLHNVNPEEWFLNILDRIKDYKTNELDKLLPKNWQSQ